MKVTVLGCGRWASFHAWYQSTKLKNKTMVWGRNMDSAYEELKRTRQNNYVTFDKSVQFTSDLDEALRFSNHIIIAISAQGMEDLSERIGQLNPKNKTFILCMKGIINTTGERLSEVMRKQVDKSNKICVWVGPGHPQEFVKGLFNIMLLAGESREFTCELAKLFKSSLIRFYQTDDLIGAEIGAAAKNVLGITAGMLDGSGCEHLKGPLMAHGIREVARLIVKMGGKELTAYGTSCLGDFQATLFSENSHNRRFGEYIVQKKDTSAIGTAEGFATSEALHRLAERYKVEMPICEICYKILHEGKDPKDGLKELFLRENADEFKC